MSSPPRNKQWSPSRQICGLICHFPSKRQLNWVLIQLLLFIFILIGAFFYRRRNEIFSIWLNFIALAFRWRAPMGKWLMANWPIRTRALLMLCYTSLSHELNCYPKAPPSSLSSLHITYSWHSSTPQHSFLSLQWWHPVVCLFLLEDDLGLQRTKSNIEKYVNGIHLWMTTNKLTRQNWFFFFKYSPQKSCFPHYFGADLIQPSQHVC